MSATDKTKLDGLVSNKVDTLYAGSPLTGSSHTEATLSQTNVSNYHTIMVVGYDQ